MTIGSPRGKWQRRWWFDDAKWCQMTPKIGSKLELHDVWMSPIKIKILQSQCHTQRQRSPSAKSYKAKNLSNCNNSHVALTTTFTTTPTNDPSTKAASPPTTTTKAPLYKDSSTETLSITSPRVIPRVDFNDTPTSVKKFSSTSSPTYSTSSSLKSPAPVRKVWANHHNKRPDANRQMNWLNGGVGKSNSKRDSVHFEENNLIIKTNNIKSDEEPSSKICLLFKPGSNSNHSGIFFFYLITFPVILAFWPPVM